MQYTIRNIPRDIDKALRKLSRRQGKSLNRITLEALAAFVGLPDRDDRYHDLDFMIGTWVEDPEFEKIRAEHDRIDLEIWQ
jgi:hypothetical protein